MNTSPTRRLEINDCSVVSVAFDDQIYEDDAVKT